MRFKKHVLHNPDFDLEYILNKLKDEIVEIKIDMIIKLKDKEEKQNGACSSVSY